MQVLLRTAFHISRLRAGREARIAIIIDTETAIRPETVAALLRPWRPWLEVSATLVAADVPAPAWFEAVAASDVQAIAVVSERPDFTGTVTAAAGERGLRVLPNAYETESERDAALFQEMAHHHFELGGLNEWDGSPVKYAGHVLQHISAANCVTHFPRYMSDTLRARRVALGRPLEALDVGSGSISRLRWGALEGLLHVTGVDPLLDVYDLVLVHHGLDRLPAIRVDRAITANAEELDRHVAAAAFDFAFCCNALDHVEDPPRVIAQIARALRPGAPFALEFATREGSRQAWHQLHQFDLFLDSGRDAVMCEWRDGRREPLVPAGVPLRLEQVVAATDDYTNVVLVHEEPETGRRRSGRRALRAAR